MHNWIIQVMPEFGYVKRMIINEYCQIRGLIGNNMCMNMSGIHLLMMYQHIWENYYVDDNILHYKLTGCSVKGYT